MAVTDEPLTEMEKTSAVAQPLESQFVRSTLEGQRYLSPAGNAETVHVAELQPFGKATTAASRDEAVLA